jgi:hypothetical protein
MNNRLAILLFVAVMTLPGAVTAQTSGLSDAVETSSSGKINWTVGEITATGIGAPPVASANSAQARAMAERAAYVVALRNLLETVKGVQVDSVSVVQNYMVKSDVIRTRVEGIVHGTRVVKKQYMSDGSVEIQVAMPMKGAFLNALVPESFGMPSVGQIPPRITPAPQKPSDVKPIPAPVQPPKLAVPPVTPERPAEPPKPSTSAVPENKPEPLKQPEPSLPTPTPESGSTMAFKGGTATGVVLDGRGLGLRPALLPKILDTQGQEIYVGQIVTRTNAVEQGVAGYAKDVNAAVNNFRVTDNPAIIKGVQAAGSARTDVIVSQADAHMLRQLSEKGDFLQYCRVIIVY